MHKYRKKPVEVEALRIFGNITEIKEFIGDNGDVYINDTEWQAGMGAPVTHVTIPTFVCLKAVRLRFSRKR